MGSGNYKHGTTLVEILVVVAVIIILAALVSGIGSTVDRYSKEKAVKATFSLLDGALEEYYDFHRYFPPANNPDMYIRCEKLYTELHNVPGSREVLEKISEKVIKDDGVTLGVYRIYDPWGTVLDYTYISGDNFPKLTSAGPDKTFDTDDDITNR